MAISRDFDRLSINNNISEQSSVLRPISCGASGGVDWFWLVDWPHTVSMRRNGLAQCYAPPLFSGFFSTAGFWVYFFISKF